MRTLTLRVFLLSLSLGGHACIARSAGNCSATSCDSCLGKEGCGWCASTSSCVPGSALGPFAGLSDAGMCPVGTYVFDSCPSSTTTGSCAGYSTTSLSSSSSGGSTANIRIGASSQVGSCGGDGAEEVTSFTTTRSMNVRVETVNRRGGSPVIYVREATCNGPELSCNTTSSGAVINFRARAGVNYYIFLDTNTSGNGEYFAYEGSLRATEVTATSPLCASATQLYTRQTVQVGGSSTSTVQGSCGGSGGEVVNFFTPTTSGYYDFSTTATRGDPLLYIRRDSCDGSEVACDDDSGDSLNASLSVYLTSGTRYYIFSDSSSTGATYTLDVQ